MKKRISAIVTASLLCFSIILNTVVAVEKIDAENVEEQYMLGVPTTGSGLEEVIPIDEGQLGTTEDFVEQTIELEGEEAVAETLLAIDSDAVVEDEDGIQIDASEVSEEESQVLVETFYGEATPDDAYSVYASKELYNKLTDAQKALYDTLYSTCNSYLTGEENINNTLIAYKKNTEEKETYGELVVSYSDLSATVANQVAQVFMFSNPQFYFIGPWVTQNKSGYITLTVYKDFIDGTSRTNDTNTMFNEVKNWVDQIKGKTSVVEKATLANDLICNNTSYDLDAPHNQSAYSVFVGKKSVCAGYAESFAILMNAVGANTICVTSSEHEWNEIYDGSSWSIVDVTWNDTNDTKNFLMKSDSYVRGLGAESCSYHTLESIWTTTFSQPFVPDCLPKYTASTPSASSSVPVSSNTTSSNTANNNTPTTKTIYRVYNPISGEHLFTGDKNEVSVLTTYKGWKNEGIAWQAATSGEPVYRLFNIVTGEHLYTRDANEKRVLASSRKWNYEGVSFYSAGTVPVYRAFNSRNNPVGSHHYTRDSYEIKVITSGNWKYEGVAWYSY